MNRKLLFKIILVIVLLIIVVVIILTQILLEEKREKESLNKQKSMQYEMLHNKLIEDLKQDNIN